ncbi:MAG: hypothetical protein AAF519_05765 [Bacteroidota bacterium]
MSKVTFLSLLILFLTEVRTIEYNGRKVRTTFIAPEQFYGVYKGDKEGFLQLNEDGTGEYQYDVFGFAPANCIDNAIAIEWGFIVNDLDERISFKREYGYSYPILLKSISDIKFQGCRKEVILDFILEYKDGSLGVSSSDDWVKQEN